MVTHVERASTRENREAVVQVRARQDTGHFPGTKFFDVPAKLMNESKDGMCLEISQTVEPGSMIIVKMVTPGIQPRDAYKLHRGQVKWCRRLDTVPSPRYYFGVRIYESVVQTVLNLSHPDFS